MSYRRKLELLRAIEDAASDEGVPTWSEEPIRAAVRELRHMLEANVIEDGATVMRDALSENERLTAENAALSAWSAQLVADLQHAHEDAARAGACQP